MPKPERKLVQLNVRKIPEKERFEFKKWCLSNEIQMQEAIRLFMKMAVRGDIPIR